LTGIEPLHRVIAVHDDKGNQVGRYPRPFDVLPVTDVNSIFTYTPNGRLSDSETTERFDGYIRRTWRAYDLQGKRILIRDLPYNAIIGTPARNTVNNIKIRASVSRCMVTNIAGMLLGEALKHANSPKIRHFGHFSTHLKR
jgi:hypothetical protein